jgi:hypothetical protein
MLAEALGDCDDVSEALELIDTAGDSDGVNDALALPHTVGVEHDVGDGSDDPESDADAVLETDAEGDIDGGGAVVGVPVA